MEGKIFKDSANIYQDQAKVLYEYYKTAAEKIVNEEKILEKKIEESEYQISKLSEDLDKAKKLKQIGIYLAIILVGLIIILIQNPKIKDLEARIEQEKDQIRKFRKAHDEIFRDYRVTKMGVAYVPVAKRVAYNDKSFIVDQSGVTGKEKFTLQVLKQNDLLNEAVSDLQDLTRTAPIVETSREPETINTGELSRSIQKINFNDYFGKMDRTLRTISFSLGNVEEYNVELPVVFPETDYAKFLKEFAASKVEGSPVFKVFDTSQYDGDIERFNQLNETRKALSSQSDQVDSVLKTLMVDMARTVQSTAAKKVASAGTLVEYSNRILFNILKAPYNFYSPVLEAEEIERIRNEKFDYESVDYNYKPFNLRDSSKVKLDIRSMSWVADDGSRTTTPFGVNQIQYEIIAPIVTNLLKDTRKERLEIYNHIKDQKLSYLNKWHQDTEDFYGRNRAEAADIINLMRGTLSEYSAAYNTLEAYKKTEASMASQGTLESSVTQTSDNSAEVLAGYQAQAKQVAQTQQEFSDYMDRLHEDIDARAEKFGYVEYYDASLRDKQARDIAVATDNVNLLDDRRKPLAEVNPLLAQVSELPPAPSIDEVAYEYAGLNLNTVASEALEELRAVESTPVVRPSSEARPEEVSVAFETGEDVIYEENTTEEETEDVVETHEEKVADEGSEVTSEGEDVPESGEAETSEAGDEEVGDESNETEEEGEEGEEGEEDMDEETDEEADEETDDEYEEEDLDLDEISELISSLIPKDTENKYNLKAMADQFVILRQSFENAKDEDEEMEIGDKLIEMYNTLVDIEEELS